MNEWWAVPTLRLLDDAEGVLGSAEDGAGFGSVEDSRDLGDFFERVDEQFFDQFGSELAEQKNASPASGVHDLRRRDQVDGAFVAERLQAVFGIVFSTEEAQAVAGLLVEFRQDDNATAAFNELPRGRDGSTDLIPTVAGDVG